MLGKCLPNPLKPPAFAHTDQQSPLYFINVITLKYQCIYLDNKTLSEVQKWCGANYS